MAESIDIRELNIRIEQQSGFVTSDCRTETLGGFIADWFAQRW